MSEYPDDSPSLMITSVCFDLLRILCMDSFAVARVPAAVDLPMV